MAAACKAKDRAAFADDLRDMTEVANKTCHLRSVVRTEWFKKVDDDTWTLEPNPVPTCENVHITATLKRDPTTPSQWNYTETVVAEPPPKNLESLCTARSQTTRFSWRRAVTEYEVGCRYVAM
jgi:hypothetical protein